MAFKYVLCELRCWKIVGENNVDVLDTVAEVDCVTCVNAFV